MSKLIIIITVLLCSCEKNEAPIEPVENTSWNNETVIPDTAV